MKKIHIILIILILSVSMNSFALAGIYDGLVAYYPFNGNANDESGNGNDGAVYDANLTSDRFESPVSAYSFDGNADYIRLANSSQLNVGSGDASIAAWIKYSQEQPHEWEGINIGAIAGKGFLSENAGHGLYVADGKVYYQIRQASLDPYRYVNYAESNNLLNDGKWHLVIGTVDRDDPNGVKLFVDGVLQAKTDNPLSLTGMILSNEQGFTIGAMERQFNVAFIFFGEIDDVRIYNRALTEEEILELYEKQGDDLDGGYNVTSELWTKAVLRVPGNPVTLIWKMVGADITPSGDQVISGYFYADPNDFAYGSEYNPELFVKIYVAKNGWCNIAYNHVTVDDVMVYSAHNYAGAPTQTSLTSLTNRLEEHQYNTVALDNSLQSSGGGSLTSSSNGYFLTSELWAKTILQPTSGPVNLIWKEVGSDTTPSGDRVISGYFYASPDEFPYGSQYNPEAFVKIYIASNGWTNIAFNHVSVDGVDISSAQNFSGAADQSGIATLNDRLLEHQYDKVSSTSNPLVGNWIQVNFLGDDDNGVWDQDSTTGIGFVAKITENEWIETDQYGEGCSVTFSYSVDNNNRYFKVATSVSDKCPFPVNAFLNESGRLEFTDGNNIMIEHFDVQPGDTLFAFKWRRQ
ncbi:LamG domain-containing protein [Desulfosarcina sp.]|nr:LamG domain-containing protein [Desulfosarcina sp.]